jgi:hypothetical protein
MRVGNLVGNSGFGSIFLFELTDYRKWKSVYNERTTRCINGME